MCVALINRFRTDSWLKDYEQVEKYSSSIVLFDETNAPIEDYIT